MIGLPLSKSALPERCRRIAGQAALDTPVMDAVDSDSRVTAQLSRLIGLAAAHIDQMFLFQTALQAVAVLCDFDADSDSRRECLRAAAAVAASSDDVASKIKRAVTTSRIADDGRGVFACALEMTLTLLEGASIQGGPPPVGTCGIVYVTGQHSWLQGHRWVLHTACLGAALGGQMANPLIAQSPGTLQRAVVFSAAIACAPFYIPLVKSSRSQHMQAFVHICFGQYSTKTSTSTLMGIHTDRCDGAQICKSILATFKLTCRAPRQK